MPTELVLLCDDEPSSQVIDEVGGRLLPGGALLEYGDGQVRQWVDQTGRAVLSVFAGRPVTVRADADRAVHGGTDQYSRWVDMTVPYGDARDGWALARALAAEVGGRVGQRG
ncbi:MAG: hypothetical protein FWF28_07950 [Micrococcales bacterium]|nr:hypothetical protein [Micrococcales bacterium]MCL2668965.1 hypothetical protein [Micrococcales bacterium]